MSGANRRASWSAAASTPSRRWTVPAQKPGPRPLAISGTSISAPPMRWNPSTSNGRPIMAYDGGDTASLIARLNAELRDAEPQAILRAAIDLFGDKVAMVSSFGAESAVLLHMAAQIKP